MVVFWQHFGLAEDAKKQPLLKKNNAQYLSKSQTDGTQVLRIETGLQGGNHRFYLGPFLQVHLGALAQLQSEVGGFSRFNRGYRQKRPTLILSGNKARDPKTNLAIIPRLKMPAANTVGSIAQEQALRCEFGHCRERDN